jgi:hypothetical protein
MSRRPASPEAVRELNRHLLMLAEELEAKKRRRQAREQADHFVNQVMDRCRELSEVSA